jgi:hypothetical protein
MFKDPFIFDDNAYLHPTPPQSYSRELDSRVQTQEMPYGYSYGEPAADTGKHDERAEETNKQYRPRK